MNLAKTTRDLGTLPFCCGAGVSGQPKQRSTPDAATGPGERARRARGPRQELLPWIGGGARGRRRARPRVRELRRVGLHGLPRELHGFLARGATEAKPKRRRKKRWATARGDGEGRRRGFAFARRVAPGSGSEGGGCPESDVWGPVSRESGVVWVPARAAGVGADVAVG
jgi:hypothetical protein